MNDIEHQHRDGEHTASILFLFQDSACNAEHHVQSLTTKFYVAARTSLREEKMYNDLHCFPLHPSFTEAGHQPT